MGSMDFMMHVLTIPKCKPKFSKKPPATIYRKKAVSPCRRVVTQKLLRRKRCHASLTGCAPVWQNGVAERPGPSAVCVDTTLCYFIILHSIMLYDYVILCYIVSASSMGFTCISTTWVSTLHKTQVTACLTHAVVC